MRRRQASAAPSIAGRSPPASERRRCHQFHDQCGEFDHPHGCGAGLAVAQVEVAALGFLRWTLACRFGGGALGFISARASSGCSAGGFSATIGAEASAGGGGGMIVGMEVLNSTLSGHLRAE